MAGNIRLLRKSKLCRLTTRIMVDVNVPTATHMPCDSAFQVICFAAKCPNVRLIILINCKKPRKIPVCFYFSPPFFFYFIFFFFLEARTQNARGTKGVTKSERTCA
jgi:hypothetical protein